MTPKHIPELIYLFLTIYGANTIADVFAVQTKLDTVIPNLNMTITVTISATLLLTLTLTLTLTLSLTLTLIPSQELDAAREKLKAAETTLKELKTKLKATRTGVRVSVRVKSQG